MKTLGTNKTVETTQHWSMQVHMSSVKKQNQKEFHVHSNDLGFICSGVSNVGGYKRKTWYNWSCLL